MGKLEQTTYSSYSQIYFHHPILTQHPSMLWLFIQYTTTRLDSSGYV